MNENENKQTMEELVSKAKSLNITGAHLFKDPEKLQAKIDEVSINETSDKSVSNRKKAPSLKVSGLSGTSRNAIIRDLERKDPDCKYMTQKAGLTPSEAEAKGIEIVKKDNGDILYCGEDIVCRTDKESYYKWQNNRTEQSMNSMKSIDPDLATEGGGSKIQALKEQPKAGTEIASG
jgi:arginyl-tRNA synthetase